MSTTKKLNTNKIFTLVIFAAIIFILNFLATNAVLCSTYSERLPYTQNLESEMNLEFSNFLEKHNRPKSVENNLEKKDFCYIIPANSIKSKKSFKSKNTSCVINSPVIKKEIQIIESEENSSYIKNIPIIKKGKKDSRRKKRRGLRYTKSKKFGTKKTSIFGPNRQHPIINMRKTKLAQAQEEQLLKERVAFEETAAKNKKRFYHTNNTITIVNNLFADVISDHLSQLLDFYDISISASSDQIAKNGFWSKILVNSGKLHGSKKDEDYETNSKAFLVGVDYRIIKNILIGGFLGKNLSHVYCETIQSSKKNNYYSPYDKINSTLKGLYGSFALKPKIRFDVIYLHNNSKLESLNKEGDKIGESTDFVSSNFVNAKIRYNVQLTDILQIVPTFGYKYNKINPIEFKNSIGKSNVEKAMSTHSLFLGASIIVNCVLNESELINEVHSFGELAVIQSKDNNISSTHIKNINLSLTEALNDWNIGNSFNVGGSSKIAFNNFVAGVGLDWKTSSDYTGFSGNMSIRLEF